MLIIIFKPFYTLYVLIYMYGLETARETISMTYSTINMYSLAHVNNLMLEITFKPFHSLYDFTLCIPTAVLKFFIG